MNLEMFSRWQSHIMQLHFILLSVLALLTLSLPHNHPNLQSCFTIMPDPMDFPGNKQRPDLLRTSFLSRPKKLRTTYPHPIDSPFRLLCAPIMSSKKTDAPSELEDNAVERNKEMIGLNNITNGVLKAAAGVWRAASNLPGNLMSEIGKLANQSVGPGKSSESVGFIPQSSFEPLAFVRKIHIPGSSSIAHILSSPPTFNVSLPRLSLPPRAVLLNWTGLPLRAAQETWRSGAGIVGQRRGKVVVRTSRELAALLEQVRALHLIHPSPPSDSVRHG